MMSRSLAITSLGCALFAAAACGTLARDDAPADAGSDAGTSNHVATDGAADGPAPIDAGDASTGPAASLGSDGAVLDGADGALPDGDSATGPDASCGSGDFYVQAGADGGSSFETITAALAAASASCAASKTVHVGPGSYSAATGESFPLVVRGVSLVGAGAAATTVQGSGPIANLFAPTAVSPGASPVSATLQVGSSTEQTVVSGLRIAAVAPVADGSEAIVCDRGSDSSAGAALVNTLIDGVTIDSYEIGVRVASVPSTPGCAIRVSRSVVQNGAVGVYAEGTPLAPVSVQLDDANTLQSLTIGSGTRRLNGGGMIAYGNVSSITVRGNRFGSSDQGIFIDGTLNATPASVTVESNDVETIANQAIALVGAISVTLVDNIVKGATSTSGETPGAAVVVDSPVATYPVITRARSNTFLGNVTGIVFRNGYGSAPAATTLALAATNFGTAGDPGNNTFRCSTASFPNVLFQLSTNDAGVPPIPFEGNTWDHAPPVSGVDYSATGVTLDVANASTTSVPPCP